MVGTSPSPARSDLSVCSAGSQTEASRHQRLFITAESVQRLNGNSVVLTSESLIFFFFSLIVVEDFTLSAASFTKKYTYVQMMSPARSDYAVFFAQLVAKPKQGDFYESCCG